LTRRTLLILAGSSVNQPPVQWLRLDLKAGTTHHNWLDIDAAIETGSLLKPFLSLAYAATHPSFPTVVCRGHDSKCWLGRGHGTQDFTRALANSCNAYFLTLMRGLDRAALDSVCLSYGLSMASRSLNEAQLIGLGGGWQQKPVAIVDAFANLLKNARDPGVLPVLSAMSLCAKSGTAKAVGFPCYAKTGTAPCCHTPRGEGDGYAVALYPENEPTTVVLVQQHNTTGAHTAQDVKRYV
jgi:cell division protein FtsI/penicillin-binding protein 2